MNSQKLRVLDLFSGIGGFSLAFERAGFQTVAFSEVEEFPSCVLAHHWLDVPNLGDVTKLKGEWVGGVDVVTGGFPCQDLSVAGKRAGLEGDRSGLFWEIVRLAGELHPTWLVLENVPGVLSSNKGRDFGIILDALGELGYGLAWRVLDAKEFGVPQRRRRVFIVGCLGDPGRAGEVLFESKGVSGDIEAGHESQQDSAFAIGGQPSSSRRLGVPDVALALTAHPSGQRNDPSEQTFLPVAVPSAAQRLSSGYGKDANGLDRGEILAVALHITQDPVVGDPTPCLSQGNGQGCATLGVAQGMAVRRLMPIECERLQGFPDEWTDVPSYTKKHVLKSATDSARYKALGNAVAVPVVEWIAHRIAEVA